MDSKLSWQVQMGLSVAIWVFIIYGFFVPFSGTVRTVWMVCTVLWTVFHPLELFISIPIGRKAGVSLPVIVIKTLLFGLTWWKPLKKGIITG
jgi:uncharacterized protein YhhL (DUF1145 family)